MSLLLEPFSYQYMQNAMFIAGLIGAVCGFLSCYLMLKGWSLIGDALSHAVVPGVAGAYILGLPFALGAFFAGGLSAAAILFLSANSNLKTDVVIGTIFTSFFALGLFLISIFPTSVDIQSIVMGNILAVTPYESRQLILIGVISIITLFIIRKDLLLVFFDEKQARTIGIRAGLLKVIFFTLLSACIVAAMQTVGAFLVIAMVITPAATAYLLSDRFEHLSLIAVCIGAFTSLFGTYVSYFLDGATGGIIVTLQGLVFLLAFFFAPKYGRASIRHQSKQNAG